MVTHGSITTTKSIWQNVPLFDDSKGERQSTENTPYVLWEDAFSFFGHPHVSCILSCCDLWFGAVAYNEDGGGSDDSDDGQDVYDVEVHTEDGEEPGVGAPLLSGLLMRELF